MDEEYVPYSTQAVSSSDCDAVIDALRSAFLTQGPMVATFESAIATYCGVDHAVALSSATAGLHLTLMSHGLGRGSVVWTSPITFLSTANAVLLVGANIDFVDVDERSGNMSIERLEDKLRFADTHGELPSAVIVVHYSGRPCDMDAIGALCRHYGVTVVEDAAHALGGAYFSGKKMGSCAYGSDTVFSLHAVKSITTGEGGIVTTNDPDRAARLRELRTHGVVRDRDRWEYGDGEGDWYYEMHSLGLNYRITDIQCALGLSQLARLDSFVSKRRDLVERYFDLLADSAVTLPARCDESAWHLFPISIPEQPIGRRTVFERMRSESIGVNVHYIPVHLQPYYRRLGFRVGDFPNSERFYSTQLSLPLHPELSIDQQNRVCSTLRSAMSNG